MRSMINRYAHPRRMAKVRFSKDAETQLATLNLRRNQYASLWRAIDIKKEMLATNPLCGIRIPARLIPKQYIDEYKIDNLWKINLPHHWRLLYTLDHDTVEIVAFVLDVMDHPDYDKKFGYGKN